MSLRWSGLNESGPHRLLCLNAKSFVLEQLRKIRRCGFVGGGVSLGMGIEVSKYQAQPSLAPFHCLQLVGRCELSAAAPDPCLRVCCSAPWWCANTTSETVRKPHLSAFLCKVPQLWCFFLAVEQ